MKRHRWIFIALSILVTLVAYYSFRFYREQALERLASEYGRDLDALNLSSAEAEAHAMSRLSKGAGEYYLAHVEVIKSVRDVGDSSFGHLDSIVRGMKVSDFSDAPNPLVPMATMASLAAMVGDRGLALNFANEACGGGASRDGAVSKCIHNLVHGYSHPDGDVMNAVQLYEFSYLDGFLFDGEGSDYYKILASEYFDPGRASIRLNSLVNEKLINSDRLAEYCRSSILAAEENGCVKYQEKMTGSGSLTKKR